MYTQCTNCKTLFRISEEQLELVGGKVRCGFCYNTFNAYEALYEEMPSDEFEEEEDSAEEQWEVEDEPDALIEPEPSVETRSAAAPSLPQDLAQEYAAEGVRVNARHLNIPTATPPPPPRPLPPVNRVNTPGLRTPPPVAAPPPSHPIPRPRAPAPQPPKPIAPAPAPTPAFEPPPRRAEPPPRPAAPPQPAAPPPISRSGAPTLPQFDNAVPPMPKDDQSGKLPNLFDAIDLAGRELQQVTRFELDRRRGGYGGTAETLATFGWGIATLVLVSAILFQIAYFARDELARHVQLRPWLERMCEVAGCKIALMRNVTLIKLVSRDIRVHPKIRDALEVRATFINDADFRQPYPVLKLDLMGADGNRVATRQFEPNEYLTNRNDIEAGIGPQQQVDVKLEILDSEQRAHGFEFSFI